MKKALVTGSGGLIGSETVRFLTEKDYSIEGIDNNMRKYFFGEKGDTEANTRWLSDNCGRFYPHYFDIRDQKAIEAFFKEKGPFDLIVHTAAQPSHDWAAKEPLTDFGVNAVGTLNLLEGARQYCPEATFIFTSTNKVYGDAPNDVPLKELETRWEYDLDAPFQRPELKRGVSSEGINEEMTIDRSKHSIFGASKVAADVMVQEYGRYFGMPTGIFRGGCLTGPQHSAVELHGFLTYIVECALKGKHYTIFGYKGKQVRDQIHSFDVANAFWHFHQNPRPGEVYNLGGGRENAVSILEVKKLLKDRFGLVLDSSLTDQNRSGDHICYYSDMGKFKSHYPQWQITKPLEQIIAEIIGAKK